VYNARENRRLNYDNIYIYIYILIEQTQHFHWWFLVHVRDSIYLHLVLKYFFLKKRLRLKILSREERTRLYIIELNSAYGWLQPKFNLHF